MAQRFADALKTEWHFLIVGIKVWPPSREPHAHVLYVYRNQIKLARESDGSSRVFCSISFSVSSR